MSKLLQGAYDLHVHAAPDVVPRKQDIVELAKAAHRAGMAGIALKDHTTPTAGRCYALNRMFPQDIRFFGCLALNPTVGGINALAVESFLREGGNIVYMPTYGAANHIEKWGLGKPPTAFPVSEGFPGLVLLDEAGRLIPELGPILGMIKQYDTVLATGHIAPKEALALLKSARDAGITRMLVTHASESVTAMTIDQQKEAVGLGAMIEHSLFAVTDVCPGALKIEQIRDQINSLGPDHVILSSDFGQVANHQPVEGFEHYLKNLISSGIEKDVVKAMIMDNPKRLLDV